MRSDAVLDAVRARLAAAGLSTRAWLLLDRDGVGIAFDDSDTLLEDGPPWSWEAVRRLIEDELTLLGLSGIATSRNAESGVVRIAYRMR